MIYLVTFEAYDPVVAGTVTERFATDGYTTRPSDVPASTHFEERVANPGTFEQSVFDDGTTSGEARVGYGFVELAIGDDGTGETLDRLTRYAVDGRTIMIHELDSADAPWSSRRLVVDAVMQQIEVSWLTATIRLRDRLEDLRTPIQATVYAGTSTDGGTTDAEGTPDDLKDKPKPLAYGVVRNVPPVASNRFRLIFDIASNGLAAVMAVRDGGVPLTATSNHATLAALMAATLQTGQYATCLATGQIRTAGTPSREITVDATEGAAGQRSAARIVQRMLLRAGFVASDDFSSSDLDALHALQPADVGIWIEAQATDLFPLITEVLDGIGAFVVPDANGVLRFGRIDVPILGGPTIDRSVILDQGGGIERIATNDDRAGVPAKKVTIEYARAWLVQRKSELDQTAATEAVKAFSTMEVRSVAAEDAAVALVHKHASELAFRTLFAAEADARTEAERRLAIYKERRDRYRVPLKMEMAEGIGLGDIVTLQLPRFDLAVGKPMLVIGREVELPFRQGDSTTVGLVTLDLYG